MPTAAPYKAAARSNEDLLCKKICRHALASIERVPCNEKHRPLNEVRLDNLTIHANPLADQMIVFPTATGPPDIQT